MFESGVSKYITAKAMVTVHFPVDLKGNEDISCKQCPFWSSSRKCRLNGSVTEFPEKYVGSQCPLEIVENNDDLWINEN